MNATELISDAISKLATLPAVFSAADVAAYADLSGADSEIEHALQAQCASQSIIALDEQAIPACRYLGKKPVAQWWISSTLRRAKRGVFHLTTGELAREMALGFDTQQWNTPPNAMLEVGRQWAMVDDGYLPGTFVFPWAKVIRNSPRFITSFRSILSPGQVTSGAEINEALSRLTEREADVLRNRRGFDTGHPATLEQIGNRYGVTRERIRQIERRAYRKLQHPLRNQHLMRAFAIDFIQSGGSLIISEPTPHRTFLCESIDLETVRIPELGLHIIAEETDITQYRRILSDVRTYLKVALEPPTFSAMGALQFLSRNDGNLVCNAENEYRSRHISKTRPYMLREALRTLGRAAHFSEIADVCNHMFPENQATTHNWHASLGRQDAERLGIVWIGTKGTYGLKEHGYSRPDSDLFVAVADIVAARFANTLQPVPFDFVMAELSKQRRELKRSSVTMALAFNDRVESVGRDEYMPKESASNASTNTTRTEYDIDAAFAAFSSSADNRD